MIFSVISLIGVFLIIFYKLYVNVRAVLHNNKADEKFYHKEFKYMFICVIIVLLIWEVDTWKIKK